ncbi:ATP-binding protein [Polaromonas aquatica]|uniref:ATP-binding protein n=1 Tax=Polaromonas aquatica TaxID=332657 RepID=UPI003D658301
MTCLPIRSLKGRVLLVLGIAITLCWAGALAVLTVYTLRGQSSHWDSKLQAIGTKILMAIPSGATLKPSFGHSLQLRDANIPRDVNLTFQVWTERKNLVVRAPDSPATPLLPAFNDGFTDSTIHGERWRVFAVSDSTGEVSVQVAMRHGVIDQEVRQKTFVALGLTTTLLLVAGLLMWFAVGRSLRPLTTLEATVRSRRKFDLTPLPVVQLPTEIRPLVESFNHLLEQLDQAMQGERRFIGDAAHELRTPLSALQAQAQVALRATTVADKDAALVKLLAVVERSTRLSDQLLDLARMDAGVHAPQKSLADLSELIMHVSQEFDMQAQQQRRSIILALTPCPIECDVDEIGILLRNLLDNALRYTPEGGRVKISCGYHEEASKEAAEEGNQRRVCLEVADDGPGVPEAEHEAIFRRFHRIPGNGGRGSGIGLSLVAGIAQLHEAAIKTGGGLDGKGFSVRVLFPLPAPPAGPDSGRGSGADGVAAAPA